MSNMNGDKPPSLAEQLAAQRDQARMVKKFQNAVLGENPVIVLGMALGMAMHTAMGLRLSREEFLKQVNVTWDRMEPLMSKPPPVSDTEPAPPTEPEK